MDRNVCLFFTCIVTHCVLEGLKGEPSSDHTSAEKKSSGAAPTLEINNPAYSRSLNLLKWADNIFAIFVVVVLVMVVLVGVVMFRSFLLWSFF